MKIMYNNRSIYEAPEAEELVVRFEENILDSIVQGGGGENAGDEENPW